MAEIVKIKKDGVIQYPITKPECVIDENGKNVLQLIKEGGGGSYDDTKIKKDIADLQEKDKATDVKLTELSAEVGKKQDTITDLADIRSGAAKGATALQSVPATYATKTYVDEAIAAEIDNALTEEY
jgi:hypothetical protein